MESLSEMNEVYGEVRQLLEQNRQQNIVRQEKFEHQEKQTVQKFEAMMKDDKEKIKFLEDEMNKVKE